MPKTKKINLFEKNFLKKLGPGVQIATVGSIFLLATGFFKDFAISPLVFVHSYIASIGMLFSAVVYFIDIIFLENIKELNKYDKYAKSITFILFIVGLGYFISANIYLVISGWGKLIVEMI